MSATQFFPIPAEMLALASETVSRRVSRLPFLRSGVKVTGELIGVTMECLNAEFTKSLPLSTPRDAPAGSAESLDRCLEQRLRMPGKTLVPVIADVMIGAGIAEHTEILDRQIHRPRKALRLLKPWTWQAGAGVDMMVKLPEAGSTDSPLSWMSVCPVCKTGILNKIVGKQLFGIPRTDFIIECTHCGAKFIPVSSQYRLVSIATISDPLWKKHLDKTYPPDTWANLARGTVPGGKLRTSPAAIRQANLPANLPGNPPGAGAGRSLVPLKKMTDGSLAVPVGTGILYFRPVSLQYSGGVKEDVFSRSQKILQEILQLPGYDPLREQVNKKYSRYLPLTVGLFLGQLKERYDPFYREFLNPFGDERYCSFRLPASGDAEKNGVMIAVFRNGLYGAIGCSDSFGAVINNLLGRVTPDDCLLAGDPVKCRINALLCSCRNDAGLFIHAVNGEAERERILQVLNSAISPD